MSEPLDTPDTRLEGKVAIITGASRGIGAAIAHAFAVNGAKLVLAARKPDGLKTVVDDLNDRGYEATGVATHVGKPEDIATLFGAAIERFGKVDVLVNNAGTNVHFGPVVDIEWPAWDKTFEVNLKGAFEATRLLVSHLAERDAPGSVINIASILGTTAAPLQGAYGMTKAAMISMTQTMAVELGHKKIRVNAICPGFVRTRLAAALVEADDIREKLITDTPLGRIADPVDIAGTALWLASDASQFVTGQAILVDGGLGLSAVSPQ